MKFQTLLFQTFLMPTLIKAITSNRDIDVCNSNLTENTWLLSEIIADWSSSGHYIFGEGRASEGCIMFLRTPEQSCCSLHLINLLNVAVNETVLQLIQYHFDKVSNVSVIKRVIGNETKLDAATIYKLVLPPTPTARFNLSVQCHWCLVTMEAGATDGGLIVKQLCTPTDAEWKVTASMDINTKHYIQSPNYPSRYKVENLTAAQKGIGYGNDRSCSLNIVLGSNVCCTLAVKQYELDPHDSVTINTGGVLVRSFAEDQSELYIEKMGTYGLHFKTDAQSDFYSGFRFQIHCNAQCRALDMRRAVFKNSLQNTSTNEPGGLEDTPVTSGSGLKTAIIILTVLGALVGVQCFGVAVYLILKQIRSRRYEAEAKEREGIETKDLFQGSAGTTIAPDSQTLDPILTRPARKEMVDVKPAPRRSPAHSPKKSSGKNKKRKRRGLQSLEDIAGTPPIPMCKSASVKGADADCVTVSDDSTTTKSFEKHKRHKAVRK